MTSHRPIPKPYKFLQQALHDLRAFVIAFDADDGPAAVLARLTGASTKPMAVGAVETAC